MPPMLEQSKLWIEHLAGGIEIAAAAIVGLAVAEAVWKPLPLFLRRGLRQDIKVESGSVWADGWLWGWSSRWRQIFFARRSLRPGGISASSLRSPCFVPD